MMDSTLFNFTELSDSLSQVIPIIRSIDEHSAPAPFTYINILISLIAALFGLGSFLYAKKTADNVSRLSKSTQIALCEDLIRDCLQIVVRGLVALKRLRDGDWYISEEAVAEIKYWPAEIYFKQDVYNSKSKIYKMIYNLRQRMQEYNNNIVTYQQMISKGKGIGIKEVRKLYDNNWKNLYKAYAVYKKLNKKAKPYSAEKTIGAIYVNMHKEYIDNLVSKRYSVSLDEKLKHTYLELLEELYKEHEYIADPWCGIENRIKDYLSQDASIYETLMRIRERQNSAI